MALFRLLVHFTPLKEHGNSNLNSGSLRHAAKSTTQSEISHAQAKEWGANDVRVTLSPSVS